MPVDIVKLKTTKEYNMKGDKAPSARFIGREGDVLPGENLGGCPIGGYFKEEDSEAIFNGKRVIVFALPGAFTPTCSSQQLPGFERMYDEFKSKGIDEIYCLSVNDGFVMNAWFAQEGVTKVKPLCDGNAEFTRGMGKLVDMTAAGFWNRSSRYAIIVDDGTIEAQFDEPNEPGDPYGVSSPENVMVYLNSLEDVVVC